MLELSDDRWGQLTGGYRRTFDPRPILARLAESGDSDTWAELWQDLYHQDNIGTASLAVVPHLVRLHAAKGVADWHTYAFVGAIELVRGVDLNPDVPAWLDDSYRQAWQDIVPLALQDLAASHDDELVRSAMGCVALARGVRRAGELLLTFTAEELDEMVSQYDGGPAN